MFSKGDIVVCLDNIRKNGCGVSKLTINKLYEVLLTRCNEFVEVKNDDGKCLLYSFNKFKKIEIGDVFKSRETGRRYSLEHFMTQDVVGKVVILQNIETKETFLMNYTGFCHKYTYCGAVATQVKEELEFKSGDIAICIDSRYSRLKQNKLYLIYKECIIGDDTKSHVWFYINENVTTTDFSSRFKKLEVGDVLTDGVDYYKVMEFLPLDNVRIGCLNSTRLVDIISKSILLKNTFYYRGSNHNYVMKEEQKFKVGDIVKFLYDEYAGDVVRINSYNSNTGCYTVEYLHGFGINHYGKQDEFELVSRVINGVTYTREEIEIYRIGKELRERILRGWESLHRNYPIAKMEALHQQESDKEFKLLLEKAKKELDDMVIATACSYICGKDNRETCTEAKLRAGKIDKFCGILDNKYTNKKEKTMNKIIAGMYPKTKDAMLVEKWFGDMLYTPWLENTRAAKVAQAYYTQIILKGKEEDLLKAAQELEAEEKKNTKE